MYSLSRRSTLAGLIGSAGLSACGETASRPLFAAEFHPADYPTSLAVKFIGRTLKEKTGGRLDVRLYSGGQLGSDRDTLEITIFGGIDLTRVNMTPLNSIVPETIVPGLPFVFRSIAHMRAAMDGAPGRKILDALEPYGLIGLCCYDSGARSFYNTKRPIRTPDDMKGLKIRVQNSDLFVSMVEALGANATPMALGEVYQALVQGVLDGAENNWPSYETTRHYEVAKYYTRTEHVMAPEVLVMSLRSWRKLSDEDQALMMETAQRSVAIMRGAWDKRVESSKKIVFGAGVDVIELEDKRAFQDKMQPVYDRYLDSRLSNLFADIQSVTEHG